MAMPEAVVQRWNEMTKDEQTQTVDSIDFLLLKRRREQKTQSTHFQLDALAGGLVYIADNFDDTPEDFKKDIEN